MNHLTMARVGAQERTERKVESKQPISNEEDVIWLVAGADANGVKCFASALFCFAPDCCARVDSL